jgi:general secretion pathway protein D
MRLYIGWFWTGLLAASFLAPHGLAQQRIGGTRTGGLGGRSSASGSYPTATDVGEATVTSDPETRRLIVVTDDQTAAQISNVVASLDRPAPQVLIKVVFLEVTYTKGLDLGVEGTYRADHGNGNTSIVSQIFGLASQGATPAPPGAGMYQLLGSDFQATLRAIAQSGKTEILSRPSVLARNNQQATITVGQQVPLITNVRYDNYGNQINAVSYTDVGIILRVTPFITSGGLVELIISPEISALSADTVTISAGVNAPVINMRSADTVVITPDGQTVVIGGLMEKTRKTTDYKMPIISSIPGIGGLFRRRVNNDSKTELLIFLTPYIVKDPVQLASMAQAERAATQLAPQSFSEQELDRFLDKAPGPATQPPPNSKRKLKK